MKLTLVCETLSQHTFLGNHSDNILEAKNILKKIATLAFDGTYTENTLVDALSSLEQNYEPEIMETITLWIQNGGNVTNNEIIELATSLKEKYGSDYLTIFNAINDFNSNLKD